MLRTTLRRASLLALTLLAVVFIFIQVQQRLFRHRAERLHDEIFELQLHPGTFADIQSLQNEWGAHAHYEGPCTQYHCIYEINLTDVVDGWPFRKFIRVYDFQGIRNPWLFRVYALFGGHPALVTANVRVHDNRMWGADYALEVEAYPGKGRNEGYAYMVAAEVMSATRMSNGSDFDFSVDALRQGFRTEEELQCLSCEFAGAFITPQTDAYDIERFNRLEFNCVTGWRSCKDPVDLAPELWTQALHDKQKEASPEKQACSLPLSILAREANDIVLAKVLFVQASPESKGPPYQRATVRILQPLKNGRAYRTADTLEFWVYPDDVRPEGGEDRAQLFAGGEYVFLYRQPRPGEIKAFPSVRPCHIVLNTPANAAMIQHGIALDTSAGESYNYLNEPYTGP